MTIPDYQTIMLPLLKFAGDKQEHSLRDAVDFLADEFEYAKTLLGTISESADFYHIIIRQASKYPYSDVNI